MQSATHWQTRAHTVFTHPKHVTHRYCDGLLLLRESKVWTEVVTRGGAPLYQGPRGPSSVCTQPVSTSSYEDNGGEDTRYKTDRQTLDQEYSHLEVVWACLSDKGVLLVFPSSVVCVCVCECVCACWWLTRVITKASLALSSDPLFRPQ